MEEGYDMEEPYNDDYAYTNNGMMATTRMKSTRTWKSPTRRTPTAPTTTA